MNTRRKKRNKRLPLHIYSKKEKEAKKISVVVVIQEKID
jgi:hypothetical protein